MTTIPEITSHENITEQYLQLNIETDDLPCGSIDFISEKINFNIIGRSFFKGMVAIKDIQLEYRDGKLINFYYCTEAFKTLIEVNSIKGLKFEEVGKTM
jgi:hypothetical protein